MTVRSSPRALVLDHEMELANPEPGSLQSFRELAPEDLDKYSDVEVGCARAAAIRLVALERQLDTLGLALQMLSRRIQLLEDKREGADD